MQDKLVWRLSCSQEGRKTDMAQHVIYGHLDVGSCCSESDAKHANGIVGCALSDQNEEIITP